MLLVGQQSTFPKLLFIENRMKIERLIAEGLLLGKVDVEDVATRDRESMHMHRQVMRSSAEPSTEDEDERSQLEKKDRRASVIQELRRQGSVFYDDSDTGMSETETGVALENGKDE